MISLALNFDSNGPQGGKTKYPALGRFNPIHLMTRTGTDAYSGVLDHRKIRGTDDIIIMPLQCGTQWDGLGHIFYDDHMWNGYDCRNVTTAGAQKGGIEKTQGKNGRPRRAARRRARAGQEMAARRLRDHQRDARLGRGEAAGEGAARRLPARAHRPRRGEARLQELGRLLRRRRAGLRVRDAGLAARAAGRGVATDTWGAEVRPNETEDTNQPWHWIAIPIMGLTVGEIFDLAELAKDCAADGRYEFLFVAPALPITGAVGSPVNPLAIK